MFFKMLSDSILIFIILKGVGLYQNPSICIFLIFMIMPRSVIHFTGMFVDPQGGNIKAGATGFCPVGKKKSSDSFSPSTLC